MKRKIKISPKIGLILVIFGISVVGILVYKATKE
tara:strand:- start:3153 stop:3254 length:102 start_codon:yes stop_codon:yes gene_type:complete